MKIMKDVPRSYIDTIVDSTICDICKHEIPRRIASANKVQSTVKLSIGNVWVDDRIGEDVEFDICPDCFTKKLIPMLAELGATPTVTDWNE